MKVKCLFGKRNLLASLFMMACFLCVSQTSHAQAWDGEGDVKVYGGYANVGGKSGVEIGTDYAVTDYISLGGQVTYVHVKDREGEDYGFLSGYDLSFIVIITGLNS